MKQAKRIILVAAVILTVLVAVLLMIRPVSNMLDGMAEEEIPAGYATYNASRYFFRFDYPEEWVVSTDTSGFGFLSDRDTGLVVTVTPARRIAATAGNEATAGNGETAGSPGTPAQQTGETLIPVLDETSSVRFFYRNFEEKPLTREEAFRLFTEALTDGSLLGDGEQGLYTLGESSEFTGEHETFLRASYTCERSTAVPDGEDEETPEAGAGKTFFRGEIYVAVRSMACYAVVFESEAKAGGLPISSYVTEFDTMIKSFRFSVFDD